MKLVTFESVSEAAEALQSSEQRASVRNVVNYLGGGSPNQVLSFLQDWKAGRPTITDSAFEIPEEALSGIRNAMTQAASKAAKGAEERASELEENQVELQSEISEIKRVSDDQREQIAELVDSLASKDKDLTRMSDDLARLEESKAGTIASITAERQAERDRADDLADRLVKAESRLESLAGVERERDNLKEELSESRGLLTDAEKRAAVAEATAKATASRVEQAEHRETVALQKLDAMQKKLDNQDARASERLDEMQVRLDSARTELTSKLEEISTLKERLAQAVKQPGDGAKSKGKATKTA